MPYTTLSKSVFDDDHGRRFSLIIQNREDILATYSSANYNFGTGDALAPNPDIPKGGVQLSYNNDFSNGLYTPITTGKCEVNFIVNNDDEHEFIKYLTEQPDWKIGVELVTNDDASFQRWRGWLLAEQTKIEMGGYPYQVKLTFVDGLSLLKDVPYKNRDNTPYEDYQSLKITIGRAIQKLRDAYNIGRFIPEDAVQQECVPIQVTEFIDLYNKNFGTSTTFDDQPVLTTLKINQQTFNQPSKLNNPVGTGFRVFEDTMSCYEVLEHICIALGCRLHMHDDTLYFISPTTYLDSSTCRGFRHVNNNLLEPENNPDDDRLEKSALQNIGITQIFLPADFDDLEDYDLLEGSTRSQLPGIRGVVYTHKEAGSQRVLGGRYPIPRTAPPQYADSFAWASYNLEQYGFESGIENVFTTHVLYSRLRSNVGTPTYFDFFDLSVSNNPFLGGTAKHDYYEAAARVEEATKDRVMLQGITSTTARELITWSEDHPLEDTDIQVGPNTPFRFQTTAYVNTNFDNDVTIGAKIVLRFVIKVGGELSDDPDYYLKQHVTHASFTDDEIPHTDGFEIIKPQGNARYKPLRATDDAVWTQTEGDRFEIVLNNPNLLELPNEFATLEHIDADGNSYEYGGGVATILEPRTDDSEVDRLRHRNDMMGGQAENYHNFRLPIDIDIPALPNDDSGSGIEMYLKDVIAYDAGGTLFTEPSMDDFLRANVRFENVKFFVGTGEKGDDAQYFAANDDPETDIIESMPPSIIGGRPNGWFGTQGYLYSGDQDYTQNYASFISGTPHVGADKGLYEVLVEEYLRLRKTSRYYYDLKLMPPAYVSGATFLKLPIPHKRVVYSVDGSELQMMPINISIDITSGQTDIKMVQMGRDTGTITEAQDVGRDPTGLGTGSTGGMPTEAVDVTRDAARRGKRPGLPVVDSKKLGYINLGTSGIESFVNDDGNVVALEIFDEFIAEARGSQPGDKVVTVDPNGHFSEVSDGSAGDFLKTNGSGVLSFAKVPGGWHGSETLIKVSPTEWVGNDVGRAIVAVRIEDDTSNTLGVQINDASGTIFAFNEIPSGYKATHVQVYASSTVTNGVEVLHYDSTTGTTSNSTTGDTNTNVDITDMTSNTSNMLVIGVSPGSTSVFVYSAHITITSV